MNDLEGSWPSYQRLVIDAIKRLETNTDVIEAKIERANLATLEQLALMRTEIALIKLRAGGWGALTGLAAAITMIVLDVLFRRVS